MIYFKDVSLSFGDKIILENVNLTVSLGSRIGLVGDNGTGKTTFLRLIIGEVEPDRGEVIVERKNYSLGYLPQDLGDLAEMDLLEFLKESCGISLLEETMSRNETEIISWEEGTEQRRAAVDAYDRALAEYKRREGYSFIPRAKQILRGLGFNQRDFTKKCTDFSGGWKMRIYLASLLLMRPDVLLLDEPTNHLDTESMEWLEGFLQDYQGTIIAVSHDRVFLDKITREIIELGVSHPVIYKGNYSAYLKEKAKRQETLRKNMLKQQAQINRNEAFIERFRYKNTKARQVQSRIKMLQKMNTIQEERDAKTVTISFGEHTPSGKEVLTLQGLEKRYGDLQVFSGINLTISRGEKVALVGVNGSGKSTLLRIIAGREEPSGGLIRWGLKVKMAFFSQESVENLNYQNNIWAEVQNTASGYNDQDKRDLLGAFLFSGDDIYKEVAVLSGGERSRLALLKILLSNANFLVLDEPTNHLDRKTKDLFQDALLSYQGTVLVVSHDRFFLDCLVGKVIEMREGCAYEYLGNYSYFIEKRKEKYAEYLRPVANSSSASRTPVGELRQRRLEKRQQAEERNLRYRQLSLMKKDLTILEEEIQRQEELKRRNESLLAQPATHKNPLQAKRLSQELKDALVLLEELYSKWDDLVLRMDQVQKGEGLNYQTSL